MIEERRRATRAHVLQRARIVFRRGYSTVDCVVLDLSSGGARIKLGGWLGLPDRFELRLAGGRTHPVEVRHRSVETTGVAFVDDKVA